MSGCGLPMDTFNVPRKRYAVRDADGTSAFTISGNVFIRIHVSDDESLPLVDKDTKQINIFASPGDSMDAIYVKLLDQVQDITLLRPVSVLDNTVWMLAVTFAYNQEILTRVGSYDIEEALKILYAQMKKLPVPVCKSTHVNLPEEDADEQDGVAGGTNPPPTSPI